MTKMANFPSIAKCDWRGRENHTVVADMDGTLMRGRSSLPYFAIMAFELGGIFKLLLLVLASPFIGLLYYFVSESAGIRIMIFVAFCGVKVRSIESVARAVLPKFYSTDVNAETWRVVNGCGKRCVLTANPRVMVEPFLKETLGVELVMATEIIATEKGRATGLVGGKGVLVGKNKAGALKDVFGDFQPHLGLGDRFTDADFMSLCKVCIILLILK